MNIRSVWEPSVSMALANFKIRNEGSFLGIFWYLLNPLALFFIILFVSNHVPFGGDLPRYPLYLIVGLVMFNFFNQLVSISSTVIQSHSNLIKSTKLLPEALVISRIFQFLLSHFFELLIIAFFVVYYGTSVASIASYILVFILFAIFVSGLCLIASTIGVYFGDFRNIWMVLGQLLFFLTPVFRHPFDEGLLQKLNFFNPLSYYLSAAREMLIYDRFPEGILIFQIFLMSTITFFAGVLVFGKFKKWFPEKI